MPTPPIKSPFMQNKKPMGLESLFQLLSEVKAMKKELQVEIDAGKKERENIASLAQKVKQIERGEKGEQGPQGIAPDVRAVAELAAEIALTKIPKPKDGQNPDKQEIIDEITSLFPSAEEIAKYLPKPQEVDLKLILSQLKNLPEGQKLSIDHIDGLEQKMKAYQNQLGRGYLHGSGVPSLSAGSNITLTPKSDGGFTVSAAGGTSTFYNDTISGTVNGVNKTFTVSNTISSALALFLAGAPYQLTTDYTVSGITITFVTAPDISLSGQPFYLIHT